MRRSSIGCSAKRRIKETLEKAVYLIVITALLVAGIPTTAFALAPPSSFSSQAASGGKSPKGSQDTKEARRKAVPAGKKPETIPAQAGQRDVTAWIEEIDVLAKKLSNELKGTDREKTIASLEEKLAGSSKDISPSARKVMQSYLGVCKIDREVKVSVVVNVYQGAMTFDSPKTVAGLKEIIEIKIKQLEDLFCVNDKIKWEMIVVDDEVSCDQRANEIIDRDFADYRDSGKLKGITIPREEVLRLASRKGANVIAGMHEALKDKSDYVVYTDPTFYIHLFNVGLVLGELTSHHCDVAVGSRKMEESVRSRPWYREVMSYVYRTLVRWLLPEVEGIRDTQCAMKGFNRDTLKDILPVDADGRLREDFVYNLSYDTNLLARAVRAQHQLKEIPIVYLKQGSETMEMFINIINGKIPVFKLTKDILGMVSGTIRQRFLNARFIPPVSHKPAALSDSAAGRSIESTELVGRSM